MSTVSDPGYWNDLYLTQDTSWDKGRVAPPIARMVDAGVAGQGRVVVLGSGPGHEALHLAEKGYEVTAVDFAAEAVKALRARTGARAVTALEADVFSLGDTH